MKEVNVTDGMKLMKAIESYKDGSHDWDIMDTLMWVFGNALEEKFVIECQENLLDDDTIYDRWNGETGRQWIYDQLDRLFN